MYSWVAFPLLRITLLFAVGIVLAVELPPSIPPVLIILILIGVFVIYLLFWFNYQRTKFFSYNLLFGAIGHLLIVTCGYTTLLYHNDRFEANHLLYQQDIQAYQIRVVDEPDDKEKSIRVLGELVSIKDSTGWKDVSGKLYVYIRKQAKVQKVAYGDILLIQGSPSRTQSPKNPGEFDYQLYLSYQNIFHQDFIQANEFRIVDRDQGFALYSFALMSREYLRKILYEYIEEDRERVIALALLLGTKEELTPEINQAYASAGAMHVLAVSGLHVGIIYGLILLFFKKSQKKKVMKWVFLIVVLVGLWSYAMLTGLSASVLRAVTMFSLMAIAKVAKRESNIYNTLSAAGLILLCYDPYLIMAVGFQLSFLAVFGIVYITPKMYAMISIDQYLLDKAWQVTCVSIAAQIATVPLVLLYFHQFPTYFFLSNLVVIPAAFAILVSGISLFTFEMIPVLNDLLGWVLESLIYLTNEFVFLIEKLPNNTIDNLYIDTTQSWLIILTIIFLFAYFYYKRLHHLVLFSMSVLFFILIRENRAIQNIQNKQIVFYSVGQHTAIDFIQGDQATLLSDTALMNNASKLRFHIKPNRLRAGISSSIKTTGVNILRRRIDKNELIIWNNKAVLILNKYSPKIKNIEVDILVLANNSVYDISELRSLSFQQLIVDGSNSRYRVTRLIQLAHDDDDELSIIDLGSNGAHMLVL